MRKRVMGQGRYWIKNSRFGPAHLSGTSKRFYRIGRIAFWKKGK